MSNPRFTGGNVGRLNFGHLNTVFEFIDNVESNSGDLMNRGRRPAQVFTARITGRKSGTDEYSWEEVAWNGTALATFPDARTSTINTDAYAYPVISTEALATGDRIAVIASVTVEQSNRRLYYQPVKGSGGGGVGVFAAKVVASTLYQNNPRRFRYTLQRVDMLSSGPVATVDPQLTNVLNLAEWTPQDGPTVWGVGTEPPVGQANFTRAAIRDGCHVMVCELPVGQFWFCVPNGYKVVCT